MLDLERLRDFGDFDLECPRDLELLRDLERLFDERRDLEGGKGDCLYFHISLLGAVKCCDTI